MKKGILTVLSLAVILGGLTTGCKKKNKNNSSSTFSENIYSESESGATSSNSNVTPEDKTYTKYHEAMKNVSNANEGFCYQGTIDGYTKTSLSSAGDVHTQLQVGYLYSANSKTGDTLQSYRTGILNKKQFDSKYTIVASGSRNAYCGYEKEGNETVYYSKEYSLYTPETLTGQSKLFDAYPLIASSNSIEEEKSSVSTYFKGEEGVSNNYDISIEYLEATSTVNVIFNASSSLDDSYAYEEKLTFSNDQLTNITKSLRTKVDGTYYFVDTNFDITYGRPSSWTKVSLNDTQLSELSAAQMNVVFEVLDGDWQEAHFLVTEAVLNEMFKAPKYKDLNLILVVNKDGDYTLFGDYNHSNLESYRTQHPGTIYISFTVPSEE